jgi:hypothetical protein
MRTRIWIGLFTLAAAYWASQKGDLAAFYIAIGWGGITYLLHAIEVKLNRLLDQHGITVWDSEIAKD